MRLHVQAERRTETDRLLRALRRAANSTQNDADFASGGITGLNSQYFGTPSMPHLAVAVGKDGYVYLLNREELGGYKQGSGGGDKVVQRLGPNGGVWSRPGVWPGNGGWVYIPTASAGNAAGGSSGFLRVYQYGVNGEGKPTLSLQATSSDAWGFGTGAPIITSEGTTVGLRARVDRVDAERRRRRRAAARLRPGPGRAASRCCAGAPRSAPARSSRTPGVGAGKLFVGNREGKVLAFGSPVTPALSGPSTSFPTTTIGQSSQKTITLTANTSLTVTKVTSSNAPVHGRHHDAGDSRRRRRRSDAAGAGHVQTDRSGLQAATLTVETSAGTLTFSLQGTGQPAEAKIEASPPVALLRGHGRRRQNLGHARPSATSAARR